MNKSQRIKLIRHLLDKGLVNEAEVACLDWQVSMKEVLQEKK